MDDKTPQAKLKRVFLALWPNSDVRQQLADVQVQFKPHEARAVIPENLHMTLNFIGSLPVDQIDALARSLDEVHCPPFSMQVNTSGYFSRPKVAWLGLENIPPELRQLEQLTGACVETCVDDYQRMTFRPHITLFRKAKAPVPLNAPLAINWPVNSFALLESKSTPEGVRYLVLKEWPLRA